MKNSIAIHKKLNRSPIPFYKEKAMEFFAIINNVWNNMYEYEPIVYTASELKGELGFLESSRNDKYFNDFLVQFSKDVTITYNVGDRTVTGNCFTFVEDHRENTFTVHFNPQLVDLIFTKKDIELMKKNKRKLQMTTKELEEYKKNKKKYSNLMLYSQADMLNVKGKYNKRLYTLLIQFKNTGKFFMNYIEFKEVMEVPKSYESHHIDKRVLNPALEELKKANIFINKIIKNKQGGRSIKTIEIYFKYKEERKPKKLNIKTISPVTKSLADEYGMSVEERNDIGLEEIQKIKDSLNLK